MATVKKTKTTINKKAVKTSAIKAKKSTPSKPKKAVLPVKKEKVPAKPAVAAKVDRKPLQKLSPREEKLLQIKIKLLQQEL
jgi:hypothetical protein